MDFMDNDKKWLNLKRNECFERICEEYMGRMMIKEGFRRKTRIICQFVHMELDFKEISPISAWNGLKKEESANLYEIGRNLDLGDLRKDGTDKFCMGSRGMDG